MRATTSHSIVLLIRSLFVGGAERQLVALSKGLVALGHDVSVITFYDGGPLEAHLEGTGVRLICAHKKGRWDTLPFLIRLIRLIREQRPDILYSFLSAANVIAAIIKPFVRPRALIWGVRASNLDLSRYDWLVRAIWRTECLFARFPTKVIANSFAGRDYVVEHGFPSDRVSVVLNGIDTDRFYPDPKSGDEFRRLLGIDPDAQIVGLVARLDPVKDHPTFLRAAKILVEQGLSAYFLCVGGGSEDRRTAMQKLAAELGINHRFIWAPECHDMLSLYNALDILCSSSTSEGFSNSIAEAMACGIGCIVTDVGDSARLVGETGLIVPRNAPDALAAALACGLRGDVDGVAARDRIVDQFSIQAMIASTEREFDQAMRII